MLGAHTKFSRGQTMKKTISLMLAMFFLIFALASCGKQTTPSETPQTAAPTVEPTQTEPTPDDAKANEYGISVPTEWVNVIFGDTIPENIYSKLIELDAGATIKEKISFENDQDKIAVRVYAINMNDDGDFLDVDRAMLRSYYDSLGIETHYWGDYIVLVVNKAQAQKLGAIPNYDTYRIGYAMAPIPVGKAQISEEDEAFCNGKFDEDGECIFMATMFDWLPIAEEIDYLEYTEQANYTRQEKTELEKKITDIYVEKLAEHLGIDKQHIVYKNRFLLLTLTRKKYEKVIGADSYISRLNSTVAYAVPTND